MSRAGYWACSPGVINNYPESAFPTSSGSSSASSQNGSACPCTSLIKTKKICINVLYVVIRYLETGFPWFSSIEGHLLLCCKQHFETPHGVELSRLLAWHNHVRSRVNNFYDFLCLPGRGFVTRLDFFGFVIPPYSIRKQCNKICARKYQVAWGSHEYKLAKSINEAFNNVRRWRSDIIRNDVRRSGSS